MFRLWFDSPWRKQVPNGNENAYGLVVVEDEYGTYTMPDGTKVISVTCQHGGSGYVCPRCGEEIIRKAVLDEQERIANETQKNT